MWKNLKFRLDGVGGLSVRFELVDFFLTSSYRNHRWQTFYLFLVAHYHFPARLHSRNLFLVDYSFRVIARLQCQISFDEPCLDSLLNGTLEALS
jgi:hypothetical protein